MRWLVAALLLLSLGCDSSEPDPDAGDRMDAGGDASAVCAVDADCEDGAFCTGERCDPAAAGADERGCVAGPGPCGDDGVCDETNDSCETCETPDADGDGEPSVACGGADCDDADANRFPGNAEVCDTMGHDEDCDPETFGPTDLDGDGQVSNVCCNGDSCGPDCNDAEPLVPALDETCNGEDDDCDGETDEGFGCAIGAEVGCEVCGEAATRGCLLDCSGFGACGREVEQCNYCDDTGDGTVADERGLAVDERLVLDCTSTDFSMLGAARCDDGRLITWLLPSEETAGAFAQPFELGHGVTEVRATLEYNRFGGRAPGAQWSLSVYRAAGSAPEPDIMRGGGPSADSDGYGAVWETREVDDQLEVFAPLWTSRGTRDGVTDVVVSSPSQVLLPLRWFIRPDDPDTVADELLVELFAEEVLGALYSCAGDACPVRFAAGDALVAYFGGAIADYDETRVDGFQILDFWNEDSPGRSDVFVRRVCEP